MKTMLDVLNVSSGRSAATMDKFPEHVLTERYASGFANSLMAKDLRLYLAAVAESGSSGTPRHADHRRLGALLPTALPELTSPASFPSSPTGEKAILIFRDLRYRF